jgi:hypothetical protein
MYNLALMFKHNKPPRYGLGGLGYRPMDFRGMIGGNGFRMRGGVGGESNKKEGNPKQPTDDVLDDKLEELEAKRDKYKEGTPWHTRMQNQINAYTATKKTNAATKNTNVDEDDENEDDVKKPVILNVSKTPTPLVLVSNNPIKTNKQNLPGVPVPAKIEAISAPPEPKGHISSSVVATPSNTAIEGMTEEQMAKDLDYKNTSEFLDAAKFDGSTPSQFYKDTKEIIEKDKANEAAKLKKLSDAKKLEDEKLAKLQTQTSLYQTKIETVKKKLNEYLNDYSIDELTNIVKGRKQNVQRDLMLNELIKLKQEEERQKVRDERQKYSQIPLKDEDIFTSQKGISGVSNEKNILNFLKKKDPVKYKDTVDSSTLKLFEGEKTEVWNSRKQEMEDRPLGEVCPTDSYNNNGGVEFKTRNTYGDYIDIDKGIHITQKYDTNTNQYINKQVKPIDSIDITAAKAIGNPTGTQYYDEKGRFVGTYIKRLAQTTIPGVKKKGEPLGWVKPPYTDGYNEVFVEVGSNKLLKVDLTKLIGKKSSDILHLEKSTDMVLNGKPLFKVKPNPIHQQPPPKRSDYKDNVFGETKYKEDLKNFINKTNKDINIRVPFSKFEIIKE